MTKLVIHVPHASTAIPEDVWSEFTVSRSDVEAEALASADLYTGEMARQAWPHAEIIDTEVSRIVVDVERYDDDSSEEMAEVGRGVFYTCDHLMRPIREALSGPRREELLARYYWPHWKRLRAQAANAILVDLHTYPVDPWPIERHASRAPAAIKHDLCSAYNRRSKPACTQCSGQRELTLYVRFRRV